MQALNPAHSKARHHDLPRSSISIRPLARTPNPPRAAPPRRSSRPGSGCARAHHHHAAVVRLVVGIDRDVVHAHRVLLRHRRGCRAGPSGCGSRGSCVRLRPAAAFAGATDRGGVRAPAAAAGVAACCWVRTSTHRSDRHSDGNRRHRTAALTQFPCQFPTGLCRRQRVRNRSGVGARMSMSWRSAFDDAVEIDRAAGESAARLASRVAWAAGSSVCSSRRKRLAAPRIHGPCNAEPSGRRAWRPSRRASAAISMYSAPRPGATAGLLQRDHHLEHHVPRGLLCLHRDGCCARPTAKSGKRSR